MLRTTVILILSFLTLASGTASALQAQVKDDIIVDGAPELAEQQQAQNFFIQDEAFDQWLFGSYGTAADVNDRLEAQLEVQLADIERICQAHGSPLTDHQKRKLQLAARGDIQRFQDRVEKSRAKFDLVKNDQNRINEVFQDIQPLQLQLQAGLFGEHSLFEKTLLRVLNDAQSGPREELLQERRRFRYRAQIGVSLAMIENGLPLLDEQRQKLTDLLVNETKPPRNFSQYDYYYVLLQITKLPEEKVRAILDEAQWELLQPYLMQARGMEAFLDQQNQQIQGELQPGGLF